MKTLDVLAAVLVVVGAINWGLVGVFRFDLVATLLGEATAASRFVYLLVGLAGAFQALSWRAIQRRWGGSVNVMAAAHR
jgi:uncharacterized membrane protein YuzA (DUF378 family)